MGKIGMEYQDVVRQITRLVVEALQEQERVSAENLF